MLTIYVAEVAEQLNVRFKVFRCSALGKALQDSQVTLYDGVFAPLGRALAAALAAVRVCSAALTSSAV